MPPRSRVLLCRVADRAPVSEWIASLRALIKDSHLFDFVRRNDLVAIKVHVGEPGLTTFLPSELGGLLVEQLRARDARPFFTDTAVLYSSPRSHGVGHTEVAIQHGFSPERAGAVFLPADGIEGNQETRVPIEGKHYSEVGIATGVASADCAVVLSHATGHLATGFGATLKNLGMGCSSRKGKLLQHSDTKPHVIPKKCVACGDCSDACPSSAIGDAGKGVAIIDERTCIGCGECIAQCRSDAIGFRWDSSSVLLQEKMVEHAMGVVRALDGKLAYVLGMVNLTLDCDCLGKGSRKVARDIGFAASLDPVALDQAVMDLVAAAEGKRLDELSYPKLDGTIQLQYAEKLGLGSRRYDLVEVGRG